MACMTQETNPDDWELFREMPDALDLICAWVLEGRTLSRFCREQGFSYASVHKWLQNVPDRWSTYQQARIDSTHAIVDQCMDISDDGANDTYVDDNGNQKTDYDVIARSRLRVEARKWIAEKLNPSSYGQKTTTALVGASGGAIEVKRFDATDEQLAAIAAAHRVA